jgi:hypothetical protein
MHGFGWGLLWQCVVSKKEPREREKLSKKAPNLIIARCPRSLFMPIAIADCAFPLCFRYMYRVSKNQGCLIFDYPFALTQQLYCTFISLFSSSLIAVLLAPFSFAVINSPGYMFILMWCSVTQTFCRRA